MRGPISGFAALFGKKQKKEAAGDGVISFWDEALPPCQVVLTDTLEAGRSFRSPIDRSLLIGFSSGMDISVNYDKSVSRKHCELFREGDLFYIVNHSQSNGTYLNKILVSGRTPISQGDIITMGRVEMRFEIE